MADLALGLLAGGAVLFLALQGFRAYCVRSAERSREEYERAFPGGCYICSHHQYGQREFGIDVDKVPFGHRCPERMQRWRGFFRRTAN